MNHSLKTLAMTAVLGLSATAASAQHTGLVLFGEPNQAGLDLPQDRQAVHPLTAPYYHEDSFVTTDLRAWYLNHQFPSNSAIGGGSANVYALQIRAALTDTLQLVAYKDGYLDFDSGLVDDDGWNDLAAGIKWAFIQDWESDLHAAVGIGYQFGIGDDDVLQQDDDLRIWGSANKGYGRLHVGATVNLLIPTEGDAGFGNSTRLLWHFHSDYYIEEWVSAVIEFNGFHTINEDDTRPLTFSGVDVANLGGGQGEDTVAMGVGGELRVIEGVDLRGAFEFPLTNQDDLFGTRFTISAVYSF